MTEDEFKKQVNVQTKQKPSESDLLRVIELAEDALDYALSQMQPFCSDEKVKQAISEIRKLRGE